MKDRKILVSVGKVASDSHPHVPKQPCPRGPLSSDPVAMQQVDGECRSLPMAASGENPCF